MSTLARRTAPPLTPLSILAQRLLPLLAASPTLRHLPPPQAQRVAVINVSAFTLTAIQPLLLMLPSHVRERVHILGADWEQFLAADLDEEALSFLNNGDRHTLARHRGRYLREAPDGWVTAVG